MTDSPNPRDYWYRMKRREKESSGAELSTLCRQLKLTSVDGKSYMTEVVNTESAFRIIQSIPSPKAEPFKRWLAQVGYQRVQEIENPELAQQRMKELYREKGCPADWIEKRVRSIAIRDELTDEWKQRGINEQKDFAILTAEISKATFGLTPTQYKSLKGLRRENRGREEMNPQIDAKSVDEKHGVVSSPLIHALGASAPSALEKQLSVRRCQVSVGNRRSCVVLWLHVVSQCWWGRWGGDRMGSDDRDGSGSSR